MKEFIKSSFGRAIAWICILIFITGIVAFIGQRELQSYEKIIFIVVQMYLIFAYAPLWKTSTENKLGLVFFTVSTAISLYLMFS